MNKDKGFTLSEMLIALSICAIVACVTIIGVASVKANMNKLSAKQSAKEIYIASENNALEQKTYGYWENVLIGYEQLPGENMLNKPEDFDYWFNECDLPKETIEDYTFGKDGNMRVLSSTNSIDEEFILNYLLPDGCVDNSITEGANYYIEMNFKTCTVYSVYYCLGDAKYNDICEFRNEEFEIDGESIGYYGGGILSDVTVESISEPFINLKNGEELSLEISVEKEKETNISVCVEGLSSNVSIYFSIDDNSYTTNGVTHKVSYGETEDLISYKIILDSLTRIDGENKHFSNLFPEFYSGEDLRITVYIKPTNDYIALPIERKIEVNSLFDYSDEYIGISAIRHLENLDKRISNLDDKVDISNKIKFVSNISFSGYGEEIDSELSKNYYESEIICTYDDKEEEIFDASSKTFYPIETGAINLIEGSGYNIYDISINLDNYENIGIIGSCNNIIINDLGLVGSRESQYLQSPNYDVSYYDNIYAGAFVGKCKSARINRCYSTTQINIENNQENSDNDKKIFVGGFIGLSNSFIEIKNSYGGGVADEKGLLKDNIKVSVPSGANDQVSVGGFVGRIESDELAEAFIYDSYQTQALVINDANDSKAWIFEGGFIGSIKFDESNVDIDSDSYMAAPIKSDITSVTLDEINNYKEGNEQKRTIRFGGIIGGFLNKNGVVYEKDPQIDITVSAQYVDYFADFCGVPELFSNNDETYSKITKLQDVGLYYRNDYGRSVEIGELLGDKVDVEHTYSISSYLEGRRYSFKDPTKLLHHYGDWQIKEYGMIIKIEAGHGIEGIDYGALGYNDEYAVINYGEEIDFSGFVIENVDGYEGRSIKLIPDNDGSDGILISGNGKYSYIAGVGTCNFLCEATTILPPDFEIVGGGEFVYNYEDVVLQITNNQTYGYDVDLNYKIYEDDSVNVEKEINVDNNEKFSTNYTVMKNAYLGEKTICVSGYVDDGLLESVESSSDEREVILSRVRINFNPNNTGSAPSDGVVKPTNYGYVEYGSSNIFVDEYSADTFVPVGVRTNYEFLGWSIPKGTVYKPTTLNDIESYALWKKIRHKLYTYSGGGWFYD